jgi:hypothetical protein
MDDVLQIVVVEGMVHRRSWRKSESGASAYAVRCESSCLGQGGDRWRAEDSVADCSRAKGRVAGTLGGERAQWACGTAPARGGAGAGGKWPGALGGGTKIFIEGLTQSPLWEWGWV